MDRQADGQFDITTDLKLTNPDISLYIYPHLLSMTPNLMCLYLEWKLLPCLQNSSVLWTHSSGLLCTSFIVTLMRFFCLSVCLFCCWMLHSHINFEYLSYVVKWYRRRVKQKPGSQKTRQHLHMKYFHILWYTERKYWKKESICASYGW